MQLCSCSDHLFKFTQKLRTIPIKDVIIPPDVEIIAIRRGQYGAVYTYKGEQRFKPNGWYNDVSEPYYSAECIVSEPFRPWQAHMYLARYVTCTRAHNSSMVPDFYACLQICIGFPRVRLWYARVYMRWKISKNLFPPDVQEAVERAAVESIMNNMTTCITDEDFVRNSNHVLSKACELIHICAWEVQKIIMIARGDTGSPFSWLPKDVCKLIHRAVFADVEPI